MLGGGWGRARPAPLVYVSGRRQPTALAGKNSASLQRTSSLRERIQSPSAGRDTLHCLSLCCSWSAGGSAITGKRAFPSVVYVGGLARIPLSAFELSTFPLWQLFALWELHIFCRPFCCPWVLNVLSLTLCLYHKYKIDEAWMSCPEQEKFKYRMDLAWQHYTCILPHNSSLTWGENKS